MASIYRVLLDGQLITETEQPVAAWAAYRATLRRGDLRADSPLVEIEQDGEPLHSAHANGRADLIELGENVTPNTILKTLLRGRFSEADVKQACADMGYPVSNSRLQGWLAGQANRKYQSMTLDELFIVCAGLFNPAER